MRSKKAKALRKAALMGSAQCGRVMRESTRYDVLRAPKTTVHKSRIRYRLDEDKKIVQAEYEIQIRLADCPRRLYKRMKHGYSKSARTEHHSADRDSAVRL